MQQLNANKAIVMRDMDRLYRTAVKATRIVGTSCVRCPISQSYVRTAALLLSEHFEVVEVDGLPTINSRTECVHAFSQESVEPWVRQHKTCPQCRAPVSKVVHLRGLGHDMPMPELEGTYDFAPVEDDDVERDAPAVDGEDRQDDVVDRFIEFVPEGANDMDW